MKIKRPTLRIFYKGSASELPAHLAHAIAAQTHRDTKAMAKAKSIYFKIFKSLKYPSVPTSTNRPMPPDRSVPCFRSLTISAGCGLSFK